jgi:hypothetical protein
LVCFLEERSADAMVQTIFPKILPENIFLEKSIIFEGKQDLEKNITNKLKFWRKPNTLFLILRDQDSEDCQIVKNRLLEKVKSSGKIEHSLIRIACKELENFYLGDLKAIEDGLGIPGLEKQQGTSKFRTPDSLNNAKQELLKLTKGSYQQISGSRSISSFMKLNGDNKSESFNFLISGVKKLTEECEFL